MTTVACDGKTMSSDGFFAVGDSIVEKDRRKVHRLKDGRLIGFAGNGYNFEPVLDYFNKKSKKWPTITGTCSIIILDKDGTLNMYDQDGRSFQRTAPIAIGSGWQFAVGAMDAGFSPTKAVYVASGRDAFSGGKVFTLSLDDPNQDAI